MGSIISEIEYFLPKEIISNDNLKDCFPKMNVGKVEKIGIFSRHKASVNETSLDLAYKAALKIFKKFDRDKIDFLLFCTQTPDYILPTSACILQDRLGLRKNIGALDFNLGCSGYVYGLSLAKGLIEGGLASNVLLLTGETYSKLINKKDRGNLSIFGDAGSATVISKKNVNKIFNFELGTDGSGAKNLIVRNGGCKFNLEHIPEEKSYGTDNSYTDNDLYMNGPEIFNFTIKNIPNLIEKTISINNSSLEEIDFVIFHQANKFMLDYLRKKIKLPKNKFYTDIESVGNTVSNTIPIALTESKNKGYIKKGDKVLLAGFGVGYSWGATIIEI
jgi:3-oxoacyl-[acyl-carrier-protein] synthase-3